MDDRDQCSFYQKIGACRHGDKCSRKHTKPKTSRTIVLYNFYDNPQDSSKQGVPRNGGGGASDDTEFSNFITDVFVECTLVGGKVEDFIVCENQNDHLNGNTYIKFSTPAMAETVLENFNKRWYNGRPIYAELSPVNNFQACCCNQHFKGNCTRAGMCNFMHAKRIRDGLFYELRVAQEKHMGAHTQAQAHRPQTQIQTQTQTQPQPQTPAGAGVGASSIVDY